LEIEGTHNFIANGIVAHNTYVGGSLNATTDVCIDGGNCLSDVIAEGSESDPLWTSNQSLYYTASEILGFGYYNSTDFDINDYSTTAGIIGFGYYNASDFSISDYYTKTQIDNFNYYNSTDFSIGDYYLKSNPYSYYNSTTLPAAGDETDPLWTSNQSLYVPYTGSNANVVLGDYNFSVGTSDFFVNSNGNIGIGTTSPLAPLHVEGSNASGITAYFENNISAEDYLYHSPFTTSSKEEALTDVLNIKGIDGEIDHTSLPKDAVSILEKPIYETIITEEERTKEICEEVLIKESSTKEIFNEETNETELIEIPAEHSTECYNETYFENVTTQNQIGIEEEPQASMGILISKLVLSVQKLFEWNTNQDNYLTEQEARIKLLEDELCEKDNSYSWCNPEIVK